jgi:hypothetical protein
VFAACASSSSSNPRPARAPRPDGNTISRSQVEQRNFHSAFEAVQSLRANWLRPRGIDSFRSPTPIWVYLDNSRVGGLEALRWITVRSVSHIRRYDALQATARWGMGHGQGVIHVETLTGFEDREPPTGVTVSENPPTPVDSAPRVTAPAAAPAGAPAGAPARP